MPEKYWNFAAADPAFARVATGFGPGYNVYTHYNTLQAGDDLAPSNPLAVSTRNNRYGWGYAQVTDQPGAAGQNQPNPPSLFLNHVVVTIGGTYYDPGYGRSFDSLADLEAAEIAGFAIQAPRRITEAGALYDLNRNGVLDNANVGLLLIRRNPAGLDLVERRDRYFAPNP